MLPIPRVRHAIVVTVLLLASTLLVAPGQAALSGVDVEPASLVAGAAGNVVVSFTTASDLAILDTVTITFPGGFDVANATKPTDCTGATGDGTLTEGILNMTIAGQVITLVYSGPVLSVWEAGAKTCTLGNITNPTTAGSTGTYSVATTLESAVNATADTIVADVLDSVAFTSAPTSTDADTQKTFVAEARDQYNNVRADVIAYSIDSGSGSIGGGTGVFTPDLVGTTVINASTGGVYGTASIVVSAGALADVVFTSAPGATDADTVVDFDAEGRDANGNTRADIVTFSIQSGSGSINATGAFTPDQVGSTVVKATVGAFSKTATINVTVGTLASAVFTTAPTSTDADTNATFVAEGRDANGNPTADAVSFSIQSGSGSIGSSTGVFSPNQTGSTVVKATVGAFSTTATINVTVGAADAISFTVSSDSTDADTNKTFTAKVTDANGNIRVDAITYSIDSGSGSINSTGVFTPNKTGTTVVKATSGVLSVTHNITVTVGATTQVVFTAAPSSTDTNTQKTFTAVPRDANDNLAADAITYTVQSGPGAINSTTGVFTPGGVGTSTITASTGVVSANTDIVTSLVSTSSGSGGGGSSSPSPKTSHGYKEGQTVEASAKQAVVHEVKVKEGVVDTITIQLVTVSPVKAYLTTYDEPATGLPDGYESTTIYLAIRFDPKELVQSADITLKPVPLSLFEGDMSNLVMLHEKEDGTWEELVTSVTVVDDQVYVSFHSDSFSDFVLAYAEEQAVAESGGDNVDQGTSVGGGGEGQSGVPAGTYVAIGALVIAAAILVLALMYSRRIARREE